MYLLVKFGGHRSYRNGSVNPYINSYINILEKVKLIPIFNFKVPEKSWLGNKTKGNCKGLYFTRKHKKYLILVKEKLTYIDFSQMAMRVDQIYKY